jgi:hypothetical protein
MSAVAKEYRVLAVAIESEAQFDQVLRLVTNFTGAAAHPFLSGQIRFVLVAHQPFFINVIGPDESLVKYLRRRFGVYFNCINKQNFQASTET